MSDLTDEELLSVENNLVGSRLAASKSETCSMLAEIKRYRAGRVLIELVVREETRCAIAFCVVNNSVNIDKASNVVACRVAKRLSVPVLSEEERQSLGYLRSKMNRVFLRDAEYTDSVALLDRLITQVKP